MRQRKIACLNWRGGVVISAFYVCTNKEAVLFVVTTEKANVALSLVFGRLNAVGQHRFQKISFPSRSWTQSRERLKADCARGRHVHNKSPAVVLRGSLSARERVGAADV